MAAVYDLETIGELELDMTQQYEAMEFCTRYWRYTGTSTHLPHLLLVISKRMFAEYAMSPRLR